MNKLTPTVYIVAGPTGVGKTAVAINLASQLHTEIISADSRQCYREMTIGTAKPTKAELATVRHHFIDEFPVTTHLTAADYESLALGYLDKIFEKHDAAVVCGGTGLYIKALCDGLDEMPDIPPEIAKKAEADYQHHGLKWLQDEVQRLDPDFFSAADNQNPARLLRALSFVQTTGHSITRYQTNSRKQRHFRIVKAGLELPREILYARINARVEKMMQYGLQAEAEQLFALRHLKNLQTVGYAELFGFIEGKYTLPQAVDKIKQHTRNYAKRQMTWFRKDKEITWLRADDADVVEKIMTLGLS